MPDKGFRLGKRLLFKVLTSWPVNRPLVTLLRPFGGHLPGLRSDFPVARRVRVRTSRGKEFSMLSSDGRDSVATKVFWRGLEGYEPGTIELFLALVDRSRTILDIGAYTGLFTLLAATADRRNVVHAFEAVPSTGERLRKNIEANGLANVSVVDGVVGAGDDAAELFIVDSPTFPSTASLRREFVVHKAFSRTLPSLTIDGYLAGTGSRKIDLMKIDTEGSEDGVLAGARRTVIRDRPMILCEVFKGFTEQALTSYFEGLGYRYFRITPTGAVPLEAIVGGTREEDWNLLFIPEEIAASPWFTGSVLPQTRDS